MNLITRKTLAASALERFKVQYHGISDECRAFGLVDRTMGQLREALRALGPSPDPDDVDRVITNDSWTYVPLCNECKTQASAVVEIGEPTDYESSTATVCLACLEEAVALARKATS